MINKSDLNERLHGYRIEGNVDELYNILNSNSKVSVGIHGVIYALSPSRSNYIKVGYGDSLTEAYKEAATKGTTCRLVHIFNSEGGLGFKDLYNFINTIGEDVIFGYAKNDTISRGLKLVMIFN